MCRKEYLWLEGKYMQICHNLIAYTFVLSRNVFIYVILYITYSILLDQIYNTVQKFWVGIKIFLFLKEVSITLYNKVH